MTYAKAKELIALNQHIIGQKVIGATIDELIIYPTDQNAYDNFLEVYLRILDGEKAILPYRNQDVEIYCVVDKKRILANGIFGHATLQKANEELDVNFG